ncbi:unnamed protein product [Ectocarpus sp. 8 AP-2014]
MESYKTQCEEVLRSKGIANFARRVGRGNSDWETLVFDVGVGGWNAHFSVNINQKGNMVHILSQPEWKTMPSSKLAQTLLFVTLLNWEVAVGSVDLDMNDGEVRYKTTAEFGEAKNIKPILATFLDYHFSCGLRYLKAFIAIRDENVSAERAMEIAGHRGGGSSDGLLAEIVRTTLQ